MGVGLKRAAPTLFIHFLIFFEKLEETSTQETTNTLTSVKKRLFLFVLFGFCFFQLPLFILSEGSDPGDWQIFERHCLYGQAVCFLRFLKPRTCLVIEQYTFYYWRVSLALVRWVLVHCIIRCLVFVGTSALLTQLSICLLFNLCAFGWSFPFRWLYGMSLFFPSN